MRVIYDKYEVQSLRYCMAIRDLLTDISDVLYLKPNTVVRTQIASILVYPLSIDPLSLAWDEVDMEMDIYYSFFLGC